jgi:hypothetical protein
MVARGEFPFGQDPFAYTTEHVYWACHSWLFDLALYHLYTLVGGAGLVVIKALLVAVLAGLLLSVRRPTGAAWVGAVCTTLAVLAMSPRLLLQPACASYFLLGLTFWLLWRSHVKNDGGGRTNFLLLALFALWVNVDEWFLLGPVLAALFWLGERLQGQQRLSGWVVLAGLAACLINPYTYHAFTLPAELSLVPWTSGLRQDLRFRTQFASPWQTEYVHDALRLNAAALAYFALSFLGLLSFVFHPRALRDWRALIWFPFALLAAWQIRAIPFFAVVAAPITTLNWQDILATPHKLASRRVSWVLRPVSGVVITALIALTWLGWLAGYDREERHVAWGVQPEPSLQQVSETLDHWRRHELMPTGVRVFAFTPEVAHHAAWFCPGEKQFFDHRYPLYPRIARDYEAVCRALLPEVAPARLSGERAPDWRQVLRTHHAEIVVVYDREPQRLFAMLHRLAADPDHWRLLGVAGQAVIAEWTDAPGSGAVTPPAFDADRLAFGPEDERSEREAPAAPGHGLQQLPPRRDIWARLARPAAPTSWESAAASTYLDYDYFQESEATQKEQQWRFLLSGYTASLAGLPAQSTAVPGVAFQVVSSRNLLLPRDKGTKYLVRDQLGPFFTSLVERPPALPLLAIRAARRAVTANPEDANAWFRLGQAYLVMRTATREHSSEGLLPPLAQLRHIQIVTALEEAVRLDPDLEAGHHELAFLYGERNYLDHALLHRRDEVRLSRRAGPRSGETAEEFAYRVDQLDKDTAKLVDLVEDRRRNYLVSAPALQGDRLAQADLALKLGLARHAVEEILLPCPADLLRPAGIKLELELLLTLGRAQEVRSTLNDAVFQSKKQGLGYYDLLPPRRGDGSPFYALPYHWPAYEWLHMLAGAAVGDYLRARGDLGVARAGLRAEHDRLRRPLRDFDRRTWPLLPGLLAGPPPYLPAFSADTLRRALEDRTALEAGERTFRAQEADLSVLEGLLALEQGACPDARLAFAEAQQLAAPPRGIAAPYAGEPIAASYLRYLNRQEARRDR